MKNVHVFNNTDYDIDLNIYRYFLYHAVKVANIDGEVNLVFSDDDYIRGLNKQFRNKDKATDVLTFPMGEANEGGDIVISYEWVLDRYNKDKIKMTVIKLIVHSILHLQGIHHNYTEKSLKKNYKRMRELYKKIIEHMKGNYNNANKKDIKKNS